MAHPTSASLNRKYEAGLRPLSQNGHGRFVKSDPPLIWLVGWLFFLLPVAGVVDKTAGPGPATRGRSSQARTSSLFINVVLEAVLASSTLFRPQPTWRLCRLVQPAWP